MLDLFAACVLSLTSLLCEKSSDCLVSRCQQVQEQGDKKATAIFYLLCQSYRCVSQAFFICWSAVFLAAALYM